MVLKGVNLGGWLVLEKWITPTLFTNLEAEDEYSFMQELGNLAAEKIKTHRNHFITQKDLAWISKQGFNAIRIPIGYWIFGDCPPFLEGISYLDWAFEQARKYNLQVLIDLHGAPGSQNGWDHSGKKGKVSWHKDSQNIDQTLKILDKLANRYKTYPNFFGLELLNEPLDSIPKDILVKFYQTGIQSLRQILDKKVALIIHDSFRPMEFWDIFENPREDNIWLDTHLYQCFTVWDKSLSLEKHIKKVKTDWQQLLEKIQTKMPVMVGEWSLGLDPITFMGKGSKQTKEGLLAYAKAQVAVFNQASGWFFWTYHTEDMAGWSVRTSMNNQTFPTNF